MDRESLPRAALNYNPAMLLRAFIIVLSFSLSLIDASADEYARSVAELDVLKREIADLKQEMLVKQEKEDTVTADLDRVEQALVDLNSQIRSQVSSRDELSASIASLEEQSVKLQSERVRAVSQLGRLLQSVYILGKQSGLRMLISQQDPHTAARRLTMYKYVTEAKNRQIHEVIDLHLRTDQNRKNQEIKKRELEETITALGQNKTKLKEYESERAKQLAKVQQALAADQSKIESYKHRERALKRLLKKIVRPAPRKTARTAVSKTSENGLRSQGTSESTSAGAAQKTRKNAPLLAGFSNNRGNLPLPVEAGIQARFGQKKQESGLRWDGILFDSQKGQSVKAIYPGQVVFSDWFRGYGQLMVLDHGDGYMSLYGHNQALEVEMGDIVQADQVIALASESGEDPSPGLYFEIRHNGNPDDPLKWCR